MRLIQIVNEALKQNSALRESGRLGGAAEAADDSPGILSTQEPLKR